MDSSDVPGILAGVCAFLIAGFAVGDCHGRRESKAEYDKCGASIRYVSEVDDKHVVCMTSNGELTLRSHP